MRTPELRHNGRHQQQTVRWRRSCRASSAGKAVSTRTSRSATSTSTRWDAPCWKWTTPGSRC
ncbi:MAG: hypothetical protein MZW92_60620 [Comamonadaceae bacterium]|nr:hypothetical protein [Comamonadaceae bacterium]